MEAALTDAWPVPPVFKWLAAAGGVASDEMARVFNCGLGMVLVVSDAAAAQTLLTQEGETVFPLGAIAACEGEARVSFHPAPDWLA